ncbi:MAG TPA: hypothetical protein VLZ81_02450, partial [Blastocatellia bacterium]|nr:hypothetical protein [Blastocatellia bacterium]
VLDRLEIIDHVCPDSRVVLTGVEWKDYQDFISRLGDDSHLRVSYSDGRLEVMGPVGVRRRRRQTQLADWAVLLSM